MKKLLAYLLSMMMICAVLTGTAEDLLPGEPSSTGDGLMPYDDVLRLIKWIDDDYADNMLYEEVVAFTGVEGRDKGNSGANSMTQLGDHYFDWVAQEDPTHYIHVCFRGREATGRFECCQWNTSGFNSAEWKDIDLSDWIAASKAGIGTAPVSMQIQRFSNPLVTVTVEMPTEGWMSRNFGSNRADFCEERGNSSSYPQITVNVWDNAEMFDFYLDKYENVQPEPSRVIAGVEMEARSYRHQGFDTVEYHGKLTDDVYIMIQVKDLDISDGTQGCKVLDTMCFSFTEPDGTEKMFNGSAGELPLSLPTPTPEPTATPEATATQEPTATPEATAAPEAIAEPEVTEAPAAETEAPAAETEAPAMQAIPAGADLKAFINTWYAVWMQTGGMTGDPREMYGLNITLTLNADGTGINSFDGETGTWGRDYDGTVRFHGAGTPLSFQSDGTLLWGSALSGYMIFSTDPDAKASVFPTMPELETPVPVSAPAGSGAAAGGELPDGMKGHRFVAVTYEAGGYTLDAATLGGVYALTLNEDGTAVFTMGGMDMPGCTWKNGDDGIKVAMSGMDVITVTVTDESNIAANYMDAMILYMTAE